MTDVFKDHRVAEVSGIKDKKILSNEDELMKRAKSLAGRLRLTIVSEHSHPFPAREGETDGGISLVLIVAESHLAIHTWERERSLHIDTFTCSPETNMRNFRREVMREFPGDQTKTKKIKY